MKKHILLIENNFFVGLTAEKYAAETAVAEKKPSSRFSAQLSIFIPYFMATSDNRF